MTEADFGFSLADKVYTAGLFRNLVQALVVFLITVSEVLNSFNISVNILIFISRPAYYDERWCSATYVPTPCTTYVPTPCIVL